MRYKKSGCLSTKKVRPSPGLLDRTCVCPTFFIPHTPVMPNRPIRTNMARPSPHPFYSSCLLYFLTHAPHSRKPVVNAAIILLAKGQGWA